MKVDIVIDGQNGDTGKGKIVYNLLKSNKYNMIFKGNGTHNAGHSIYHNNIKYITHIIPAGIFFNILSIIGPGCLVNPKSFFEELDLFAKAGFDTTKVKIASNTGIILDKHLEEDSKDSIIGTTKKGMGPATKDRYGRTGLLAYQIPELKDFIIDFHQELQKEDLFALYEGSQGYSLDIFLGDYPYVSSSHCTVAGALLNGIPHTAINEIFLSFKAYETYVGNKKFQPEGEVFNQMRELGNEYGSTTKRPRQCNYLNLDELLKAIFVNSPTIIICSKMDVLQQLNTWKIIEHGKIIDLENEENFKSYLLNKFPQLEIKFSYSPKEI